MGSASDGAVPGRPHINPSKPFLLHAQLTNNHTRLRILIDAGASATRICLSVLRLLSGVRYLDTLPRSFILADGAVPLNISGSVELTMQVDSQNVPFHAFVTEKLCVDLILGMDFMLAFHAVIEVSSQRFSLEFAGRRHMILLDDHCRRLLVALLAQTAVTVPARSTLAVSVYSSTSSITAYFIPISSFLEHPFLVTSQKIVCIHNHSSCLLVTNSSDLPQYIPSNYCFGYLLNDPSSDQPFIDKISILCSRQNAKKSCHPVSLNSILSPSIPNMPAVLTSLIHHLPVDNRGQLLPLLRRYSVLFDNSHHNISDIVIENVFNTIPHTPPASRPHRNPHTREETQRLIDEFLAAGIIQESNSPYAAPAFIVPRKDNRPGRLVVDYRALNRITIPDASPLPHGEDLLQELGKGYKFFSKLDLKSGYHQFRIPLADQPKTAFVVSQGHYEFLVLSMGPQNAPAGFQKTMATVMRPCREFCLVFLDDLIIFSRTFAEHLRHLELAFATLLTAKLVLNVSKCEIAVSTVIVLGHTVSEHSLTPTNDAIQAILNLQEPRTLKQANKFLGGLAYYRKFVPNFANIAAPIHTVTNLTRDKRHLFKWSDAQSQACLLYTSPSPRD